MHSTSVYGLELLVFVRSGRKKDLATNHRVIKHSRQFCYVIKIFGGSLLYVLEIMAQFSSSHHLYTSNCWCNPIKSETIKSFAIYLAHSWTIFISNNIPKHNLGAPLLGLAKSIYYTLFTSCSLLPKFPSFCETLKLFYLQFGHH